MLDEAEEGEPKKDLRNDMGWSETGRMSPRRA